MDEIRVIVVDDVPETCENIRCLLQFDPRIKVVGEARDGMEALKISERVCPDVILMDINMPVLDGIAATEMISMKLPGTAIIIMSVQGEQEYLKRSMAAGAREYIIKPFTSDELVATIYRVYDLEKKRQLHFQSPVCKASKNSKGKVITVFSTKGGVGKTTLAVNLGVSLAKDLRKKVVLVDLDLQFGDVAIMLNINPRQTLADLAADYGQLDAELLHSYLTHHTSGMHFLAAPARPEYAELVSPELVEKVINTLVENYDYVLIDADGSFSETSLMALDCSQTILLLAALDLPTLKNLKLGLEVLDSLHYRDKVKIILNRATSEAGIVPEDVKKTLGDLAAQMPSDGQVAVRSANKGCPFCLSYPQSRIAESVRKIASLVNGDGCAFEAKKKTVGLRFF